MATKKKLSEKERKAKKESEKVPVTERGSISDLIASINSKAKMQVIQRASDMNTSYLLRRPCGITSLDIALGGGFPASAITVFVGPDGSGKDYLLWKTAAEVQKIYGDNFAMAVFLTEFKADKRFMRDFCGLEIAFSDEELDEYDEVMVKHGRPILTDEERESMKTQTGEILIIDGVTAERGFDAIMAVVQDNRFQIVVVNSVGSLQTEAKESLDSFEDFARQSSEATLLSAFIPKLSMTMNNSSNGRNETAVFIVNQMRSKRDGAPVRGRPVTERDKYEPGAKSWALKHGKAIEITLHKGPFVYDQDKEKVGRTTRWELTKGKLGTHDGKVGEFDFYYNDGVDVLGDLINTCKALEVVSDGRYIEYVHDEFGFKVNGRDNMRVKLIQSPELVAHLRERCFEASEILFRHS
jgi:RecA/RadA recombinase